MRYYTAFILLALGAASPALALEQDTKWKHALQNIASHPEVTAYLDAARAAKEFGDGALGLPDPMLFIENRNISGMDEEKMLGFSQSVPAFGARRAAAQKYAENTEKSRLMAGFSRRALEARLITTLAHLQKVTALEKIAQEQKKLLGVAAKSARGRVAANIGGVEDVSMIGVEAADIDLTLADLEEERHGLHNLLEYLTGSAEEIEAPKTVRAEWDGDVQKTWPVMIAAAEKKMTEAEVKMQETTFRPSFELGGSINRMDRGENSGTLRLGFSVPLWSAGNQAPKLRGAQALLSARSGDEQKTQREMQEKLSHLQRQIAVSVKKEVLLKEKIAAAEKNGADRKRGYAAGKSTMGAVVAAKVSALDAKAGLAREQARQTELIAAFNSYIAGGHHE